MEYAYFPGCSQEGMAKEYGSSIEAVAEKLGIELKEIEDWVCCGATPGHATSHTLGLALPAQTLTKVEDGKTVVTGCAACYSNFKRTAHELNSDPATKKKIEEVVEAKLPENIHVKHFLEVLIGDFGIEKIKEKAEKSLNGLKVACYYGCLLTRPPKITNFDDKEKPVFMDNLVNALGGEAIKWNHKTECCGASLVMPRVDVVVQLVDKILDDAQRHGAECVITACPLCQPNLDMRQQEIKKSLNKDYKLPIIYFTQLVGIALGISPKKLMLDKIFVNPMPLCREKGLLT